MLQNDKKSNVIIERILQYIQYLDISESKFSIKMGKDRSFVSQLKSRGGLSVETLCEIAQFYSELNFDWIITGRGEMLIKTTANNIVNEPEVKYESKNNNIVVMSNEDYAAMKYNIEALQRTTELQNSFIAQILTK